MTMAADSKKSKFTTMDCKDVHVMLVGSTGSGKSQLINILNDPEEKITYSESDLSPSSISTDAIRLTNGQTFIHDGVQYKITYYDTRGISDSSQSFDNLVEGWNDLFKKKIPEMHYVIFVITPDRISSSLMKEMNLMMERLEKFEMKRENVIVVMNKCDFFLDTVLDEFERKFNEMKLLPAILKDQPIIRTCCVKRSLIEPSVSNFINDKIIDSRDKLLLRLTADVTAFNPRQILLTDAEKEAARLMKEANKSFWEKCLIS